MTQRHVLMRSCLLSLQRFCRFHWSPFSSSKPSPVRMASTSASLAPQKYDYFLVLDFEATCEDGVKLEPQEIIEFPCLKINASTLSIDSTFHRYVRPVGRPVLSEFCTRLTGITQQTVDQGRGVPQADDFEVVLHQFQEWLSSEGLLMSNDRLTRTNETGERLANKRRSSGYGPASERPRQTTSALVTCGDWDLQSMLPRQCKYSQLQVPVDMTQWVNVKRVFHQATGQFPTGMMSMLSQLNIEHQGRHHSGIDDCHNISAILCHLLANHDIVIDITGRGIAPVPMLTMLSDVRCCMMHDHCYDALMEPGGQCSGLGEDEVYVVPYSWHCQDKVRAVCDKNSWFKECADRACACDAALSNCIAGYNITQAYAGYDKATCK